MTSHLFGKCSAWFNFLSFRPCFTPHSLRVLFLQLSQTLDRKILIPNESFQARNCYALFSTRVWQQAEFSFSEGRQLRVHLTHNCHFSFIIWTIGVCTGTNLSFVLWLRRAICWSTPELHKWITRAFMTFSRGVKHKIVARRRYCTLMSRAQSTCAPAVIILWVFTQCRHLPHLLTNQHNNYFDVTCSALECTHGWNCDPINVHISIFTVYCSTTL